MRRDKVIESLLFNSMGLKKGESLLFLTDNTLFPIAETFYKTALKLDCNPLLLQISDMDIHGQEPGFAVAKMIKAVDVALLITSKSLSHTRARREASRSGVRIASMPGLSYELITRSLNLDYRSIEPGIKSIAVKLTRARIIRVVTPSGTDISFSVEGRDGLADCGIYDKRGSFGNLPAGEAFIAPLEGLAEGLIVFDGSAAGFGRLDKNIKVWIEKGKLIDSKPKYFIDYILRFGSKASNLAEFGIGLNPKARITGNILEDEKALNTAHFAFGTNKGFGGKVDAGVHLDAIILKPKIYLDSKELRLP